MNVQLAKALCFDLVGMLTSPLLMKHRWMVRRAFESPYLGIMVDYLWKDQKHVTTVTLTFDEKLKETKPQPGVITMPSFELTLCRRYETCDLGAEGTGATIELESLLTEWCEKKGVRRRD